MNTPLSRHVLHNVQKSGCLYTLQNMTDTLRNNIERVKEKQQILPFITELKLHKLCSLTSNLFMQTKIWSSKMEQSACKLQL